MIIIQIAGHLGQDPETRYTPTNKKVTTLRVATNIKRGSKEKTVWWRVTIWGDRFDQKLTYLKKGSALIVMGEMGIPEMYTDKEGNPQTSFEIVADSLIFNPFGSKSGTDRQTAAAVGAENSEEYAMIQQSTTKRKDSGSDQSHTEKEESAQHHYTRPSGIIHGSANTHTGMDFDTEDDIPF